MAENNLSITDSKIPPAKLGRPKKGQKRTNLTRIYWTDSEYRRLWVATEEAGKGKVSELIHEVINDYTRKKLIGINFEQTISCASGVPGETEKVIEVIKRMAKKVSISPEKFIFTVLSAYIGGDKEVEEERRRLDVLAKKVKVDREKWRNQKTKK